MFILLSVILKVTGESIQRIENVLLFLFIAEEETDRKKRLDQQRNDRLSYKRQRFSALTVQNILWLIASMAAFHITDFHLVVLYDPRINR